MTASLYRSGMVGRILVVDDEPDIRELVRLNLEIEGHDPVLVPDGQSALDALEQGGIDLVLLDVMMPGIDGWEVLRRVKGHSDPTVSEVPVIMLTARADELDQVKGGIEGAVRSRSRATRSRSRARARSAWPSSPSTTSTSSCST